MAAEAENDWEDWEEWDGASKFSHHVIAGSCAGVMEHISMFPLDTLRTLQQTHAVDSSRVSLRQLFKEGGVARLYRGASSVMAACIPAHAAYFSIYESSKAQLMKQPGHHPIAAAACGAAATLAHDCIMTPLDVVKQRLQLGLYDGVLDCLRKVIKYEGVRALFVSFPTTLLMNIPYGGVMVATNESLKHVLNPSGERNIPAFFISGAGAGGLAALITNPLDVAKTRLQTQCILLNPSEVGLGLRTNSPNPSAGAKAKTVAREAQTLAATNANKLDCASLRCTAQSSGVPVENCKVVRFTGLLETMRVILQEEGLRGFARGLRPRLTIHIPSVATTWTTYEVIKRLLVEYE